MPSVNTTLGTCPARCHSVSGRKKGASARASSLLGSFLSNSAHAVVYTRLSLFDKKDPSRLLERADAPFLRPETEWQQEGSFSSCEQLAWILLVKQRPCRGVHEIVVGCVVDKKYSSLGDDRWWTPRHGRCL